jgi:hypothetical protein
MGMEARVQPPVLVTAFNRPHLLENLLDRLHASGVTRLYLAIDGPRHGHLDDTVSVERCVALAHEATWASEVTVHVNEVNLGCGRAMHQALSWFFSYEEEGIILEDDILPDPTFLLFASTLLDRYRDDERIHAISGCCLVPRYEQSDARKPYRFSRVPHVWGWAAWRRSWGDYQFDLSDWRSLLDTSVLWEATQQSLSAALYWGFMFDSIRRGRLDTWDAQWVLASFRSGRYTATANINLTENRGFGIGATHTHGSAWIPPRAESIAGPLPGVPVSWDRRADHWIHSEHLQVRRWLSRALQDDNPYFSSFREEIRALAAQAKKTVRSDSFDAGESR